MTNTPKKLPATGQKKTVAAIAATGVAVIAGGILFFTLRKKDR